MKSEASKTRSLDIRTWIVRAVYFAASVLAGGFAVWETVGFFWQMTVRGCWAFGDEFRGDTSCIVFAAAQAGWMFVLWWATRWLWNRGIEAKKDSG